MRMDNNFEDDDMNFFRNLGRFGKPISGLNSVLLIAVLILQFVNGRANEASSEIKAMREELDHRVAEMRSDLNSNFSTLNEELAASRVQAEQLREHERRIQESEARLSHVEEVMSSILSSLQRINDRLDNLKGGKT